MTCAIIGSIMQIDLNFRVLQKLFVTVDTLQQLSLQMKIGRWRSIRLKTTPLKKMSWHSSQTAFLQRAARQEAIQES